MSIIKTKVKKNSDVAIVFTKDSYSGSELSNLISEGINSGYDKCIISRRCYHYFVQLSRILPVTISIDENPVKIGDIEKIGKILDVDMYISPKVEYPRLSDNPDVRYDIVFFHTQVKI